MRITLGQDIIDFLRGKNRKRNKIIREYFLFKQRWSINRDKINCNIELYKGSGVNSTPREKKIIVAMTSFPDRIYDIHFAIYSLMKQSLKPDKFILYLAEDEFPNKECDLPQRVLMWKNFGLSIQFCESIGSFKKFIPAYREYGNDAIIVTVDDDMFYAEDWLEILYKEHQKYPNDVIAHIVAEVAMRGQKIRPYNTWEKAKCATVSFRNFFIGLGGVLYPPRSLNKDVLRRDLFEKLAPKADDIWLWAMAVLNNTKIRVPQHPKSDSIYTNVDRFFNFNEDVSLWDTNIMDNDKQLKNVIDFYPEIIEKLMKSD